MNKVGGSKLLYRDPLLPRHKRPLQTLSLGDAQHRQTKLIVAQSQLCGSNLELKGPFVTMYLQSLSPTGVSAEQTSGRSARKPGELFYKVQAP